MLDFQYLKVLGLQHQEFAASEWMDEWMTGKHNINLDVVSSQNQPFPMWILTVTDLKHLQASGLMFADPSTF